MILLNVEGEHGNKCLEINNLSNKDKLFNDILNILCDQIGYTEEQYSHQIKLHYTDIDEATNSLFLFRKRDIIPSKEDVYNRLNELWDNILLWLDSYSKQLIDYKCLINIINHKYSNIINLQDYSSDDNLKQDIINIMRTNTKTICNSDYFTIASKNALFYSFDNNYDIIQYNTSRREFPYYSEKELQINLDEYWRYIKTRLAIFLK